MAIVGMHSFELVLLQNNEQNFLKELQRFKDVQFDNLAPREDSGFNKRNRTTDIKAVQTQLDKVSGLLKEIQKNEKKMLKKLKGKEKQAMRRMIRQTPSMTFDELEQAAADMDITPVLAEYERFEKLDLNLDKVLYHFEPWLDSEMPDRILQQIRDAKPIIGTVHEDVAGELASELLELEDLYMLALESKGDRALFFVLPSEEVSSRVDMLTRKYHMQYRTMESAQLTKEVLAARHSVNQNIRRRHPSGDRLRLLTKRKEELEISYEDLQNQLLRLQATQMFLYSDSMVLIKGWIPSERREEFTLLLDKHAKDNYILQTDSVPQDSTDVPVKLKSNWLTSAFTSITTMYALPRYNEIDPTPVLCGFYIFFFGMMLADMGYGLILILAGFLAPKILSLKPDQTSMMRFLGFVGIGTFCWGAVYGSFFGDAFPIKGLIDPNKEYTTVLIMSLGFGVFHIFVALGVKAYMYIRDGRWWDAICDVLFYYMAVGGGVLLLAGMLSPVLAGTSKIAMWVAIAGVAGLLLTGGRKSKSPVGKAALGFYNVYGLINYASDIISYSRLMALGLAGGSIAIAINLIVGMLSNLGIIGVIAGMVVFVGFGLFNMFISALSAYVHTIRLTYVEFFGKFYEGGGRAFVPFRSTPVYINITT